MSYKYYLFIKRLHRNSVLKTYKELNQMDDCTKCNAIGFIKVPWDDDHRIIPCDQCGGTGEIESFE